ncbi:dTDP-glucose 4%2C6-dehydratase [Bordetella ansorpii]|uniref:dTDP-glucose 4,6-dehydratase n=1 Tax=Bordetella ansorpii TaxID=288768 RepID=A0A157SU58_9BORD|nr:NAD-dependent epimerase/dehydratase family protein [Bordetella ansorpii]SAI73885.1 dTDP-glucose 4%2C6-dehydratase [Bordetella ansorpii]
MRILVTGATGFIGKNLMLRLSEMPQIQAIPWTRSDDRARLPAVLSEVDAVVHLAGVNRPQSDDEFATGNTELTRWLATCLMSCGRKPPVIMASSLHAERDSPYGASKRRAEDALRGYARHSGAPVYLYRLPNVFGKWARPHYNSVVATFAHEIVHGRPIVIYDRNVSLRLVYVDDVIDAFLDVLQRCPPPPEFCDVPVEYHATVGQIADTLHGFERDREALCVDAVGTGLVRALYATYVSYLPPSRFCYAIARHADARGEFVEMLKTGESGQFSYFTAAPGVTRGSHYHHSKTEKFLVVRGQARFGFRHMVSGERHEIYTKGGEPSIVETVPGWTHDITNIGSEEMVVMLWANEVFDRQRPDTIFSPV